MALERNFGQTPANVTVALVDGITHTGLLAKFSPAVMDLALLAPKGAPPKVPFPAERIAYVGFHRNPGDPPQLPSARRGGLKVHVSATASFLVDPEPNPPGTLGFYAKPAEPTSPFREIFFYNHGIRLREINEPIGSMLVKEGRVGQTAVEEGLKAQKDQPRTPIGQILVEHKRVEQGAIDQAAALQKRKGTRLGEVLIEAGLADQADIDFALQEQRKRGGKRIGQILVEMSLVSEVDLSTTLAKKFQLPFVDLDTCVINLSAVEELPRDFVQKQRFCRSTWTPRRSR